MGVIYVIEHGESCPLMPYYATANGGWRRGLKAAKGFQDEIEALNQAAALPLEGGRFLRLGPRGAPHRVTAQETAEA